MLGTIVATALITSIISTAGGWVTTRMLNSPVNAANAIEDIKATNLVRDLRISNLEEASKSQKQDIEYIRRSMEQFNLRNGIVIK